MFEKSFKSGLHQRFTAALLYGNSFPHQSSGMFRPSEASVTLPSPIGPITKGSCKRKTYYRLAKVAPSGDRNLPHQIQRMNVGKEVENAFIETCKKEGLYVGNNIPFRVDMDGISIAGELDAVLRTEPCGGTKYILECKSVYGYYPQKRIFGRGLNLSKEPGAPRDSYIMQISIYLNYFSRLPEDNPSYLPFGAIFVCDRGDGHFGVFDIWLEENIKMIGEDEIITSHKIFYESEGLKVPRTLVPYTTEDIIAGFKVVQQALTSCTPPPRDFVREYSKDQVEYLHSIGEIPKTSYEKWIASHGPRGKGKETLGAWACQPTYCPWSDLCWSQE